jgi:hypothetical protein
VLVRYKEAAIKYFNEELDQLGIDPVNIIIIFLLFKLVLKNEMIFACFLRMKKVYQQLILNKK